MAEESESGQPWYFIDAEMMTEKESSGRIALPKKVAIVQLDSRWNHLSAFLHDSVEEVRHTFSRGPLAYKIAPYAQFAPMVLELAAPFFLRNLRKFGTSAKYIEPLERAEAINAHDAHDFEHRSFSCELYSGNMVLGTEEFVRDERGKDEILRVQRHLAIEHEKSDIAFNAGFNEKKRWYYAVGLMDKTYEGEYNRLLWGIRGFDTMNLRTLENVTDERFGIEYAVFS